MADFEVKVVPVGESSMHCTVFGHGAKTLVIIPGVSIIPIYKTAEAVAEAFDEFDDDYTVFLFDRIDDLKPGHMTEDLAEDTVSAMKALGLKDIYLYGASHGGMISQYIAEEYPELVKKLALCSTLSRQNAVSLETFERWERLSALKELLPLTRDITSVVYANWYYKQFEASFKEAEKVGDVKGIERFGILANACHEFDRYDELKKITCPTIVFGAWEDRVLGYQGPVEIAEALKCTLVIKSIFGHAVYDECAGLKTEVRKFFDEE